MIFMKTLMKVHKNLYINIEIDKSESDTLQTKKKIEALNIMQKQFKIILIITTTAQKKHYDKQHKSMFFKIGNKIMVCIKNICMM